MVKCNTVWAGVSKARKQLFFCFSQYNTIALRTHGTYEYIMYTSTLDETTLPSAYRDHDIVLCVYTLCIQCVRAQGFEDLALYSGFSP